MSPSTSHLHARRFYPQTYFARCKIDLKMHVVSLLAFHGNQTHDSGVPHIGALCLDAVLFICCMWKGLNLKIDLPHLGHGPGPRPALFKAEKMCRRHDGGINTIS